jgi:hypothetical protein
MTFGEARQLDDEISVLAVRLTERCAYLRRSAEHCAGIAVAAGRLAIRVLP